MMQRAPIAGILACLVASLIAPVSHLSASHCAWTIVPTPNPGGKETFLTDIDGVGEDLWAVGSYTKYRQPTRTLVEHLTPDGWQVVSSPNLNRRSNALAGVRYLAAGDVWAVGTAEVKGGGARNLMIHWSGVRWEKVAAPSSGRGAEGLFALDAAPATEISDPLADRKMWAVGASTNLRGGNARGMVLHYDGSSWSIQELPTIDQTYELRSVVAFSDTDVWATGPLDISGTGRPLVMHYDGTAWSRVVTPNPGVGKGGATLLSIAGEGPSDLYVAGFLGSGDSLVMHFDGTAWTVEPTPAHQGESFDGLQAVDTQPSGDVWTAGFSIPGSFDFRTLVHYRTADGSWTSEAAPNPAYLNALVSVLALDGGPIWAAGIRVRRDGPLRNLLIRCG